MDKEIWIASYSNKFECFHLETLGEHERIGHHALYCVESLLTDYNMVAAFEDFIEAGNFIEHLKDQRNQKLVMPRKKLLSEMPKESDKIINSWVVSYSWSEGFIHLEQYSKYVEYVRQGFILGHPVENYFVIGITASKQEAERLAKNAGEALREAHKASRLRRQRLQADEIRNPKD